MCVVEFNANWMHDNNPVFIMNILIMKAEPITHHHGSRMLPMNHVCFVTSSFFAKPVINIHCVTFYLACFCFSLFKERQHVLFQTVLAHKH